MIATSTTVPLTGVNANIDDSFFKNHSRFTKNELKNASELRLKAVEADKQGEAKWRTELKAVQKGVDSALLANIGKIEHLKGFLGTRFTISNGVKPHELRF